MAGENKNNDFDMLRMEELVAQLNSASRQYYKSGEGSHLTDSEWDEMFDELQLIEARTGIILDESPSRNVGFSDDAEFDGGGDAVAANKVAHLAKLYSMDKINTPEGLEEWLRGVETACIEEGLPPGQKYSVEYKFDGLTASLLYENGMLKQAATRGNGILGEDILPHVMVMPSVPKRIEHIGTIEVQGEIIMRLSKLKDYNETAQVKLANARNAAAGAVNSLDPRITAQRGLEIFFYQIGYGADGFSTQTEMNIFLKENTFQTSEFIKFAHSADEIHEIIKNVSKRRMELDFLIDGMVIKLDDVHAREVLGYTDRFPRWEIAYKFPPEQRVTLLKDVVWDVGRTGKLTPTAILAPVDFMGVKVSRATLNNWEHINRKNIRCGDKVILRRSNDVIPEIIGMAEPSGEETNILPPEVCPSCAQPVQQRGELLFCNNTFGCRSQLIEKIIHFASRNAMDIAGLSKSTAMQLVDTLGVEDVADIYELEQQDLERLDKFKEKKINNLLSAISGSKHRSLDNFIYALGIPGVGLKTSSDIAEKYSSFNAFRNTDAETLGSIFGVGDIMARGIIEWFDDERNTKTVDRLFDMNITPEWQTANQNGIFADMRVAITGALPGMTRKQAQDAVKRHGGQASSAVGKKTSLLVVGDTGGDNKKTQAAQNYKIHTITAQEFLDLLSRADTKEDK